MNASNKAYKAADHLKDDKQWGYDKKGNSLNPVDKMKKERKKDELAGAPNVKKESFVNWRQDLKEIPNYEEIPISAKKRMIILMCKHMFLNSIKQLWVLM